MKEGIKTKIKLYMTEKRSWIAGGTLERIIGDMTQHKTSNVGRRLRELEDEGIIEARYVSVPGVANKVVEYRIKQSGESTSSPDCCPSFRYFKIHAQDCPIRPIKLKQNEIHQPQLSL